MTHDEMIAELVRAGRICEYRSDTLIAQSEFREELARATINRAINHIEARAIQAVTISIGTEGSDYRITTRLLVIV